MLDRLLELSDRHGHNELSFQCDICIEIKSLKEKIQQAIEKAEKYDELMNKKPCDPIGDIFHDN